MTQNVLHNKVTNLKSDTGISDESRQDVARLLADSLADTYRLFANTQGVHWNVQGPLFYSIHKLTEEQYEDMFEAIDDIAERIRALGSPAPQTLGEFAERSEVTDVNIKGDLKMQIRDLIDANELTARRMRAAVMKAEEYGDVKTADLLTSRIGSHEENAWMLRATIAS
ncbi:MAG: DNA starvation/stationary phase protection protein [Pseudomonadota bacterium]